MTAKKKPIDIKTPTELGVTGGSIEVVSLEPPPPRIAGRKLEAADAAGFASQLVKALREEAKVI
jgi:electron transfer flavoprotein beta subunit